MNPYNRMFEAGYLRRMLEQHQSYPYWVEHDGDKYPFDTSEQARHFCDEFNLPAELIQTNPNAVEPNNPTDLEGI